MRNLVKTLLLAIIIISTNVASATNPVTPTEEQKEFNKAQFLIFLDEENAKYIDEYLFIIDHSWYEVSEDSFYAFCENYCICKQAIDEYNAGNKNVDFDCVFDY